MRPFILFVLALVAVVVWLAFPGSEVKLVGAAAGDVGLIDWARGLSNVPSVRALVAHG